MIDVLPRKEVSAKRNDDFYVFTASSGYRMFGMDPAAKLRILPRDSTAQMLGTALRESLPESRFMTAEESLIFFASHNRKSVYENWVNQLLKQRGYKSRQAMFKNMDACSIEVLHNEITMFPMTHEKLEAWGRTKDDGIENVVLPEGSLPENIGSSLLLAFSRCS